MRLSLETGTKARLKDWERILIIATAYCYHDWVQVAFLFSLSVILYLILFAGVFVDTVLDMTRAVSYTHLDVYKRQIMQ